MWPCHGTYIVYIGSTYPSVPWGKISTTCTITALRNDEKNSTRPCFFGVWLYHCTYINLCVAVCIVQWPGFPCYIVSTYVLQYVLSRGLDSLVTLYQPMCCSMYCPVAWIPLLHCINLCVAVCIVQWPGFPCYIVSTYVLQYVLSSGLDSLVTLYQPMCCSMYCPVAWIPLLHCINICLAVCIVQWPGFPGEAVGAVDVSLFDCVHGGRSHRQTGTASTGLLQPYRGLWWVQCPPSGHYSDISVLVCPIFNSSPPSAAYMRQWIGSALVQINGLSPICC